MPGGSITRRLLQKRTYSNQPNNFATSNSQHRGGPSNEEELERTNNVDEGDEQVVEEEDSEIIPTQGYNPAVDPVTKKPPLEWKGNCFLNQQASRIIGKIWSRRFTGPWFEFKLVPQEIRNILFDEFKRNFSYDETHEPTIRKIWETTAKDNLKKKLNRAREAAKIANKTTSIAECKDHPPFWIPPNIWNEMINIRWAQEEFEKRREIMRKNRLTPKEGSYTRHCAGSVSIASHNEQIKVVTGKEPAFHEAFRYWHVLKDPSNSKNSKKICKSSRYVDNKSAKTMENYLKKKAESEEAMDVFNSQHWMDSSGGLTKGKMYGAPYVDANSLHGGYQSSSANAHPGCTSTPTPSTQPILNQISVEEIVQRVLDKLKQSPGITMQSALDTQATDHVVASPQPAMPAPPYIPDQSSMPTQSTMPTHATMPTQSQQTGFSPFTGTFPHFIGHRSMSLGAHPSQQSPLHSNTFGTAQHNVPFFDLMQQQLPYVQQYSHMHQFSGPSMPYQPPRNFEEHQRHEGME